MRKVRIESIFFLVGFAAFCAGLWLIYQPLPLVLGGLVLMGTALPRGEK